MSIATRVSGLWRKVHHGRKFERELDGQRVRQARSGTLLDTLVQDARYGMRTLARTPAFTTAAVIALALGIGANAAIFSVVDAVILRPLPYENPGRLAVILRDGDAPVSPANFADWREQSRSFENMGAAEYWTPNMTGVAEPEKLWALHVTPSIFPMLGIAPLVGRTFLAEEGESGAEHEVVLGYSLWQRRFGGDPRIVGESITLDGAQYTVVGVMPRDFKFAPFWATKTELWAPLVVDAAKGREASSLRVFARLAPGVSLRQAQAEIATITARLEREYPGTNRDITVQSLKEKVVGDIRPALLVELGAVSFVLLIACANVAHMLLARAAARRKELALRTALGASRARVMRQLLIESLLLSLLGGGAGLLLALGGIHALVALAPAGIPRIDTIGLDARALLFLLGISLLTGVGFGLVPALRASATDLNDALKEGGRVSTEGIRRNRFRSVLMASEFALALMLLVGAGLMIRSFIALRAIDPGFDPHNLLTMVVPVAGSREAAPERRAIFYEELLQRVRTVPGVVSASAINHLPLAGDEWGRTFRVEGRPLAHRTDAPTATYRVIFPGYFRTMEIPLLRGRDVAEGDDLGAPAVVVVNEFLANRYWPGEDPIGKRITLDDPERDSVSWLTVVGVVKNAARGEWAASEHEEVYLPFLQNRSYLEGSGAHVAYQTLVIRTSGEAAALAPAVRNAVWSLDSNLPVSEVQTMDAVVARATAQPRFNLFLLATFAAVALVLAAVGIYGVMSYSVSRRTHEIGLRMALGARPGDVLGIVVGQAMALAIIGACVGFVGALALGRFMSSFLYGVQPSDPLTFLAMAVVLGAVALAASYIPARRATRIDPLLALRHE
ncbi:MAG TPA: ABC transporter permease [Gemmatimonadaceae bacterium]|nr:ABC transporter permease [Gemmatimonadaceae bacterium]